LQVFSNRAAVVLVRWARHAVPLLLPQPFGDLAGNAANATNQPTDQHDQPTNTINRSTDQPINRSTDQPINGYTTYSTLATGTRPPAPMPAARAQPIEPNPGSVAAPRPVPLLLMTRELGIGGCERDLAKLALGIDRARFEPHVACFVSGGFRSKELERARVPILDLAVPSFRSRSFPASLRRLSRYLSSHRIQILHALDVPANLLGSAVGFVRRVPLVITSQLGARDLYDRRTHRMLRWTDRLSHLVIVNSEFQRRQLLTNEGVRADHIAVCYNGVDHVDFHPPIDPARRRNALPPPLREASLVIGTVAALRPEKDLATLIEAFARVQRLGESMRLVVVGDGPMLEPWKSLAGRLRIDHLCHFEPATANVADWIRAMDVFVMCSISESFSNSLLEAMACGCCPVATRVGGLPEMVIDEENGLLVEAGNPADLASKLERVIRDDALREALGAKAAQHAHGRFSVQAFVRNMEEIYLARFRKARPDWPV
jgi:glycosyltransferase involved in cell wall biosynthesis